MTTTYIGTTERAAIIRKELKAKHGWTSRDVSVRADHYSLGSSIDVRIKNPNVPLATVKAVAEQHENIHYDEYSGEILGGGNRYVHVSYTSEALAAKAAPFVGPISEAAAKLATASESSLLPIEGTDFLLGRGRHGHGFSVWMKDAGFKAEAYDLNGIAEYVAVKGWNH